MSLFVVDVESDGGLLGHHNMVCFGVVKLTDDLKTAPTFYGKTRPITEHYDPDALAVSGFSREEHEEFDDPVQVMEDFAEYLKTLAKHLKKEYETSHIVKFNDLRSSKASYGFRALYFFLLGFWTISAINWLDFWCSLPNK